MPYNAMRYMDIFRELWYAIVMCVSCGMIKEIERERERASRHAALCKNIVGKWYTTKLDAQNQNTSALVFEFDGSGKVFYYKAGLVVDEGWYTVKDTRVTCSMKAAGTEGFDGSVSWSKLYLSNPSPVNSLNGNSNTLYKKRKSFFFG